MSGRSSVRHLATAALLGALVAATGAAGVASAQEKVLRVVLHADLRNTDPIWTTAIITRHHAYMIYDTLFSVDENLEPRPQMVGDYSVSDDGLTYSFTLRDGLTFHDGSPVTSADVIPSLKRWGARDTMAQALMEVVDRMEEVDERTFRIVLKEPYGLVLDALGKADSNVPFIMPKRLAETDPFEQVTEFIGSGPYRFVEEEWVPGSRAVYVRNEDYVPRDEPPSGMAGGKVVKVDRVESLYLPDPATAIAALQNGEIDFYESPPPDLLPALEADPNIVTEVIDQFGFQVILRPNALYPPFDKPEARRALARMVDQSEYMTAMVGDPQYWQVCTSMYLCGTPDAEGTTDNGVLGEPDLDEARELLQAAGYDGGPVVVMHPTDHPSGTTALVTASKLREIGVNVDLQAMDWATLTSRRTSKNVPTEGGWNIFHTRITGISAGSPVSHLGINTSGDDAWFGWPEDEKIEELRQAWAKELDAEKRHEISLELHEELLRFVPYVPVGQYAMPSAWRSNVKGLLKTPTLALWNIEVE